MNNNIQSKKLTGNNKTAIIFRVEDILELSVESLESYPKKRRKKYEKLFTKNREY